MKIKSLPTAKIIVKERIRSDLGDVEEFAARIKEHGLAQPIAVNHRDGEYHLIWGERRLIAYQSLGKTKIDCRVYENLTDEECVLLEIAENKDRKQFTDDECKKIVAYMAKCPAPDTQSVRGAAKHLRIPRSTYQDMKDRAQGKKRERKPKESAESVLFTDDDQPEPQAELPVKEKPVRNSPLTELQTVGFKLQASQLLKGTEQDRFTNLDGLKRCRAHLESVYNEVLVALGQSPEALQTLKPEQSEPDELRMLELSKIKPSDLDCKSRQDRMFKAIAHFRTVHMQAQKTYKGKP